jgi:hypothetical protein
MRRILRFLNWVGRSEHRGNKQHALSRSVYRRTLACEPLEDRCLLSVASPQIGLFNASSDLSAQCEGQMPVSVAVSPSSVAEDGTKILTYTFTRTGTTTGALRVNFMVGGTATLDTDYGIGRADTFSATAGSVTIADGESSAVVTIYPTADSTVEPDETVVLTVAAGTGYTVGSTSAATGTILNDDPQTGPIISGVVAVPEQKIMTWNARDCDGVASASLTIDGMAVSKVYGPYAAASGVNFAGIFGRLSAGTHKYAITATDKLGNSSHYTGSFIVTALTIETSALPQEEVKGLRSAARLR